jgi:hypothetical protein
VSQCRIDQTAQGEQRLAARCGTVLPEFFWHPAAQVSFERFDSFLGIAQWTMQVALAGYDLLFHDPPPY